MSIYKLNMRELAARADKSSSRVCVLVGAGVSMLHPTKLPSGNELRDLVIQGLLGGQQVAQYAKKILQSTAYQSLLPELVLQDAALFASSEVDSAMAKILTHARPNEAHRQIQLKRWTIFTTNFDHCFEAAGARMVGHLHGSIERPGELQNRFFRLGKTAKLEAIRFQQAIKDSTLIVLGYSIRDSDVSSLIEGGRPREILYLSYDGELPVFLLRTRHLVHYAVGSVQEFLRISTPPAMARHVRQPIPRIRISLARQVNIMLYLCFRAGQVTLAQRIFAEFCQQLRGRYRCKAAATLANTLRVARMFRESMELCIETLKHPSLQSPKNGDVSSALRAVMALCELDRGTSSFSHCGQLLREALRDIDRYARVHGGKRGLPADRYLTSVVVWRARLLNNLGYLRSEQGMHDDAVILYKRSLAIKERFSEEVGWAQTAVNLAASLFRLGRTLEAICYLERAAEIMEKAPDAQTCRDALTYVVDAIMADNERRATLAVLQESTALPPLVWRSIRHYSGHAGKDLARLLKALRRFEDILRRVYDKTK